MGFALGLGTPESSSMSPLVRKSVMSSLTMMSRIWPGLSGRTLLMNAVGRSAEAVAAMVSARSRGPSAISIRRLALLQSILMLVLCRVGTLSLAMRVKPCMPWGVLPQ